MFDGFNNYQTSDCTRTANRVCSAAINQCGGGGDNFKLYRNSEDPTTTTDRVCVEKSVCATDGTEYQDGGDGGESADRSCSAITQCDVNAEMEDRSRSVEATKEVLAGLRVMKMRITASGTAAFGLAGDAASTHTLGIYQDHHGYLAVRHGPSLKTHLISRLSTPRFEERRAPTFDVQACADQSADNQFSCTGSTPARAWLTARDRGILSGVAVAATTDAAG